MRIDKISNMCVLVLIHFIKFTSVFSLDISISVVSINSLKNSFGFLSAQAGLAMNNLRYTPPTTGSLVAMSILFCVSGNFNMALGFRLCNAWYLKDKK